MAELTAADVKDRLRIDSACKVYTLDLAAGKTYQIDMIRREGGFVDPYLRLEDPRGLPLAADDDGGGNPNARIVFNCMQSGTYRIIATSFSSVPGPFTLKVQNVTSVLSPASPLPLEKGFTEIIGKLTGTDPRDRVKAGSPCRVYAVELAVGKTYQIDMITRTTGFDPYLRLEDAQGIQLAFDDDGGGFPNARILFLCSGTGTYRIVATTYNGNPGEYSLKVQEK